jgi:ABC-type polysaccharide/polyol phosphate transport system ATPase subunit
LSASITAAGLGVRFMFDRQRRVVTPLAARFRRKCVETWGLRDMNLEMGPGEAVALLGVSGSGKTTLLRAIAGIMPADAGRLDVRGRVATLLSVDAGLLPLLTGRENARLLAALAGLRGSDLDGVAGPANAFSELDGAFDLPVSSYSQGMRARLSFAVAQCSDPQILLLDEVHEALDHTFRATIAKRAESIRAQGGIVVAAGHDHELLARLCPRAILLSEGAAVREGPFDEVRAYYLSSPGMERATPTWLHPVAR